MRMNEDVDDVMMGGWEDGREKAEQPADLWLEA